MSEPARSDSGNQESLSLAVGDRTHRTIGLLLAQQPLPEGRIERVSLVMATVQQVLAAHPVGHSRSRAANVEVGTLAACYVHRFLLDGQWQFKGAEVPLGSGRVDLLFRHALTGQWLVDEIKTNRTRAQETELRPQIDRYVAAGQRKWGDAFRGVRLCALSQPRSSRLFTPHSKRSVLLVDTDLAGTVA